jgi:hypothetical protein
MGKPTWATAVGRQDFSDPAWTTSPCNPYWATLLERTALEALYKGPRCGNPIGRPFWWNPWGAQLGGTPLGDPFWGPHRWTPSGDPLGGPHRRTHLGIPLWTHLRDSPREPSWDTPRLETFVGHPRGTSHGVHPFKDIPWATTRAQHTLGVPPRGTPSVAASWEPPWHPFGGPPRCTHFCAQHPGAQLGGPHCGARLRDPLQEIPVRPP